jgi:Ser/Thr protein kinase RdoA (MazF antagonist)
MFALGRVKMGAGGMLEDDDLWAHPALMSAIAVTGESHLRDDLRAIMPEVDRWLDVLDSLPQTYVHGDASPQNLLVPVGDPDQFVVIDFSFHSPHCVGFDLGQLLVGLVHSELMDPGDLRDVQEAILPAYIDGLHSAGLDTTNEHIEQGFVLSLLVRSLFTAVPLEMLHQPDSPELRQLLTVRIRMARYLLNLAENL